MAVLLTGCGNGKTASASGMVVRACGHGMRVIMIQFMKGDIHTGEWYGLSSLDRGVELTPPETGRAP